jgi:hypothetical protein
MATAFMKRMVLVYGAPDTEEPEAFVAEYVRILKSYSDDILNAALDRLLKTRKFKTWPSIAECVGAAEDENAARVAANKPKKKPTEFPKEADEILMTPLGAKAAHEGWVLGLYDHVFRHGSRPSQSEIYDLIDNAKFVDRCAAGAVDMGVAHVKLLELAKNMLIRRESLARRALSQPPLTDGEKKEMRA